MLCYKTRPERTAPPLPLYAPTWGTPSTSDRVRGSRGGLYTCQPAGPASTRTCGSQPGRREFAPHPRRLAPATPPRRAAHSVSRRCNDLWPPHRRRALRAPPGTRCTTTVCAPLRGACSSTEQPVRLADDAVLRRCCAGCKLHEMLQVLARTASRQAREMA